MTSTPNVETFVIIPHEKYEALEEQARQQHRASEPEQKMDTEPDPEPEPEPELQPELQPEPEHAPPPPPRPMIKNIKSVRKRALEKFLQAIENFQDIRLKFPDLHTYIKSAIGQSKIVHKGEEKFFMFLLEHSLFHLVNSDQSFVHFQKNPHGFLLLQVKNRSKISRYFPSWFRAA